MPALLALFGFVAMAAGGVLLLLPGVLGPPATWPLDRLSAGAVFLSGGALAFGLASLIRAVEQVSATLVDRIPKPPPAAPAEPAAPVRMADIRADADATAARLGVDPTTGAPRSR